MTQHASLPLLTGNITLDEALDDEDDVLQKISYPEKRLDLCSYLHAHAADIEAIAAHHLGLPANSCKVPWVNEWLHGSFNICIPIYVNETKQVMIRFPLPYKVGELACPGNAAEKLRTEVATYAWIQSHCPDVPIPRLWGFSFPGGLTVSDIPRESKYHDVANFLVGAAVHLALPSSRPLTTRMVPTELRRMDPRASSPVTLCSPPSSQVSLGRLHTG